MKVVLAEKVKVATPIAAILGATERHADHYAGNGWLVTWAIGHLLEIAPPEAMNPAWEKWDTAALPMLPTAWLYAPRGGAIKQLRAVSKMLREAEFVVAATDADREGEHIFRLIYGHSHSKAPVKRLWVSSLTDEALRAGLAALHPSAAFDALAAAAAARAHADWLVGLNTTRAYTLLNGTKCSVGRVQTPTLALVVGRHREIAAFRSVPYAEIDVDLGLRSKLLLDGEPRIQDLARAKAILDEIKPWPTATVTSVDTRETRTPAPPLFSLLALQKEANKRFGFTAARTLELAQELYERKHLTYPRTESRHLSRDLEKELSRHLAALAFLFPDQVRVAAQALIDGLELGKAYVDDAKLTSHHAIIPTTLAPEPDLAGDLRKLYELVARRFLGIFLPAKVADETTVELALKAYTLRARGVVVKDPGWTVVLPAAAEAAKDDDEQEDDTTQTLPPLAVGQLVAKSGQRLAEKKTHPPKPYTDGTLIEAMKTAGRLVTDKDLAQHMKANGLGTSATRAETIEKLLRTQYLERQQKYLVPTPKGIALIDQVDERLRDPVLTAEWEQRLADVEDGGADAHDLEVSVAAWVAQLVPSILRSKPMSEEATQQPSLGPCPKCKTGAVRKTPKGWGCSRYKEAGCDFVIWAEIAGKKLSEATARELVASGSTAKAIEGFLSKEKKKFAAKLRLDDSQKVVFAFEERQPAKGLGPCPACKQGTVRSTPKGWGCDRYREGCSLAIWREYHGKTISEGLAREILEHGRTLKPVEGLSSKDGQKKFAAILRFDERWHVVLAFDDKAAETTPPAA